MTVPDYYGRPGNPNGLMSSELTARIASDVESGMSFAGACKRNGISDSVAGRWLRRAKTLLESEPEELYPEDLLQLDFAAAVWRAQGEFEKQMVNSIVEAASEDYKAAEWLLERRYKQWAARHESHVEVESSHSEVRRLEVDVRAELSEDSRVRTVAGIIKELGIAREIESSSTESSGPDES